PILAWAHGTTGVADTCAPSGDYVGGPVHSYQEVASNALDSWLARGYAVVAPDYQGLGTLGAHPYMNAKSQLHTVVDAVRALHAVKPKDF
ncbi:lipase family protein, partial [Acinetobacter baumannii]